MDSDSIEADCSDAEIDTEARTCFKKKNMKSVYLCVGLFEDSKPTVYFQRPNEDLELNICKKNYIKSRPVLLRFKYVDGHRYNCVINTLKRAGFIEQTHSSSTLFNVYYGTHPLFEQYRLFKTHQLINHFPGSSHLGRKDLLWRAYTSFRRRVGAAHCGYMPETFVMPQDRSLYEIKTKEESKGIWIVKPVNSSCGRGIEIVRDLSLLPADKECIASRYISNPLLIDNRKFDLRMYVLVTSFDPLIMYVFQEGLVRICTRRYTTSASSLKHRFVHLTNFSVQRKSAEYVSNIEATDNRSSSKWSISTFRKYLRERGIDDNLVFASIHDIFIKTMLSIESIIVSNMLRLNHRENFEIFGFDILLDSALKPYLLEVNVMPSLSSSSPMDKKIKTHLMCDAFQLAGVRVAYPKSTIRKNAVSLKTQSAGTRVKTPRSVRSLRAVPFFQYPLSTLDLRLLKKFEDQYERRGDFIMLFPRVDTWIKYGSLFEVERYNDILIAKYLEALPDRNYAISYLRDYGKCKVRESCSAAHFMEKQRRSSRSRPHTISAFSLSSNNDTATKRTINNGAGVRSLSANKKNQTNPHSSTTAAVN